MRPDCSRDAHETYFKDRPKIFGGASGSWGTGWTEDGGKSETGKREFCEQVENGVSDMMEY